MCTYTAKDFRQKHTAKAYLEAATGHTVIINNDRYKGLVFELTARPRDPLKGSVTVCGDVVVDNDGIYHQGELKEGELTPLYSFGDSTIETVGETAFERGEDSTNGEEGND